MHARPRAKIWLEESKVHRFVSSFPFSPPRSSFLRSFLRFSELIATIVDRATIGSLPILRCNSTYVTHPLRSGPGTLESLYFVSHESAIRSFTNVTFVSTVSLDHADSRGFAFSRLRRADIALSGCGWSVGFGRTNESDD